MQEWMSSNPYESDQMIKLASRIIGETSKIFWLMHRVEFLRLSLTFKDDLQSIMVTVDTI